MKDESDFVWLPLYFYQSLGRFVSFRFYNIIVQYI